MGDEIQLICILTSKKLATNVFPVPISITQSVAGLRRAIKEEVKVALEKVDANDLILWKLNTPIEIPEVDTKNFDEALALAISDLPNYAQSLRVTSSISEYFGLISTPNCLHLLVQAPSSVLKRYPSPDDGAAVIKRWQSKRPRLSTPMPLVTELTRIADAPLDDDEKIPVSLHRMKQLSMSADAKDVCTPDDVGLLFRAGEGESLLEKYFFTVVEPPPRSQTEDSFHSFWDRNVREILELVVPLGKSTRNSSVNTATRNLHPDYAFLVDNLCPFRGEEKAPGSSDDPRSELASKLVWAYESAPYVLGYYATGPELTLVAIGPPPPKQTNPVIHNIAQANLSFRRERIRNIRRLINLSKLFHNLVELVRPTDAEFEKLERENCTVEIAGPSIIKVYKSSAKVRHLENIYALIEQKSVPNTDRLHHHFDSTVILSPRGLAKQPATEKELVEALVCILGTITVLHQDPIILHRDIRWPNVIRRLDDPTKWFLIDWDDAACLPTTAQSQTHFCRDTHAPSVFQDHHGPEVDVWGVGELILQSGAMGITPELEKYGRLMKLATAPSAHDALQWMVVYQK